MLFAACCSVFNVLRCSLLFAVACCWLLLLVPVRRCAFLCVVGGRGSLLCVAVRCRLLLCVAV